MPRELLVALRMELRAVTGHWAEGFTACGQPIAQHDSRGAGGACVTCELLTIVDTYLYPGAVTDSGDPVVEQALSGVVDLTARRVAAVPPGQPLGGRGRS